MVTVFGGLTAVMVSTIVVITVMKETVVSILFLAHLSLRLK